jgi:predicted nucleotidyltransferase
MPELDAEIARAAEVVTGIAVLVVFGSRAGASPRPDSDLDVGVLPDLPLGAPGRRHLQVDLAVALSHLAPEGRVDVVLMDEAPDLLRQRIMEAGRVVLCRDRRAWRDLRVRTMREYGDREWERRLYQEAQRRRLEKGEPSGRSGRALVSLERVGKLSR